MVSVCILDFMTATSQLCYTFSCMLKCHHSNRLFSWNRNDSSLLLHALSHNMCTHSMHDEHIQTDGEYCLMHPHVWLTRLHYPYPCSQEPYLMSITIRVRLIILSDSPRVEARDYPWCHHHVMEELVCMQPSHPTQLFIPALSNHVWSLNRGVEVKMHSIATVRTWLKVRWSLTWNQLTKCKKQIFLHCRFALGQLTAHARAGTGLSHNNCTCFR